MNELFESLNDYDIDFINKQKIFFVATAPKDGKINLSPKGLDDSFKVVNKNKILWLNYFGSGNETAAHLVEDERMTIMFCSFEGDGNILRLYCKAKAIQEKDKSWDEYLNHFPTKRAARQVFELDIIGVGNACGMGVPLYDFVEQRKDLTNYYDNSSKEDHINFMKKNNQKSLDGKPTKLFED